MCTPKSNCIELQNFLDSFSQMPMEHWCCILHPLFIFACCHFHLCGFTWISSSFSCVWPHQSNAVMVLDFPCYMGFYLSPFALVLSTDICRNCPHMCFVSHIVVSPFKISIVKSKGCNSMNLFAGHWIISFGLFLCWKYKLQLFQGAYGFLRSEALKSYTNICLH